MPSVAVPEEARARGLPYVLTDIMTYFTMLVGIYFPSVTGEARVPGVQHTPPPLPPRPRCCFSSRRSGPPGSHTRPPLGPHPRPCPSTCLHVCSW